MNFNLVVKNESCLSQEESRMPNLWSSDLVVRGVEQSCVVFKMSDSASESQDGRTDDVEMLPTNFEIFAWRRPHFSKRVKN